ncbi:MAG: sugar phosphate isomerase/epimerase [Firmicutes bacterium]|nr:sugar phosphate isomerase/epimerase [Bacillota bacterium]
MVTLSAFADEVSSDLKEQMDILEAEGVKYIELRGVWGKNVKDLTDEEVSEIRAATSARGFGISAIGSPIGKFGINDDFHAHLQDFLRCVDIAKALNAKFIRIFSFYIPKGEDPAKYRADVMGKLKIMRDIARQEGVKLAHENEKHIYGDTGDRCADIMHELFSDDFCAIFDPANFVQCGQRPYEDAFVKLKGFVRYCHIKDAMLEDGRVVPAGEGDGDVKRVLSELIGSGYSGFLSLEPHLSVAEQSYGRTNPELFSTAAKALKRILNEIGAAYR